jgi:tetratricopeptide (TPR) repeat protein
VSSAPGVWPPRGGFVFAGAIGVVALLVRGLYVWQISSAPFLDVRIGDAEAYHSWALRIASGDWIGTDVFYQSPLYPYVLAIVYTLLNDSPTTIRGVQAVLGSVSCVVLAWAGISLFGRIGALAGFGLAVYPAAIFLDGQLDKSVLVTLLLTALLALLAARDRERFTLARAVACGVVLGLLALARENALLVALPVLAWMMWPADGRRVGMAASFLAGLMLVLAPVAARNLVVGGELHLTTAQFGPNLYIGNHEGASGTYEPLVAGHGSARDERADATRLAEEGSGRSLTAGEVSRYWTTRALAFVRSEPASWMRLTAHKGALTLSVDEFADTESQHVYADASWLLRALTPFSFGILLALAAAGTVLTAHRAKHLWILYAMVLTYLVSVALFYVVARYRFPLVPILLLLAAGAIAEVVAARQRIARSTLAAATLVSLLALFVAHLTRDDVRAARAMHYAAIAATVSSTNTQTSTGFDDAIALYTRALGELPGAPSIAFGLATALTRAGRTADALPHFRATIAAWPDHAEARYNFGVALAAVGQQDAALEQFDEAIRLRPADVDARMALGRTLLALERPDAAAAQYERVIEQQPRSVKALAGLGIALTMAGRVGDALAVYDRALALDPNDADVHNNLGWSLAMTGRIRDALPHFARALTLNPTHANARENLARGRAALQ